MQTVRHLAARARAAGATIREGVEVTSFELGERGVEAVLPSAGPIPCEVAILAPGPWAAGLWHARASAGARGRLRRGPTPRQPLSAYWKARRASSSCPVAASGAGRPRATGRPPGPARAAALRPRRPGDRRGRLGHLLPPGRTGTAVTPAASRSPSPTRPSTPTGRRTPFTAPSPGSPSSSSPAWPPPFAASAAAPASGGRRRAGQSITPGTTTRSATGSSTTPTR